jgi:hypothetical protein
MATARSDARWPGWSVWVAGGALVAAMLGQVVLAAPQASANCTLTAQDEQYIHLLAQNDMIHTSDFNDCRLTTEGRWLADQVRTAADPMARSKSLITLLTDTSSMDAKQAEWEVESAIYVYAPEMVPKIKDQAAHPPPTES